MGLWNDRLKVALRAPPQDGRANAELCGLLAEALGLRASALEIVAGARSRQKEIFVPLPPQIVRRRLLPTIEDGQ